MSFSDITMYETLIRPHQVDSVPPLTPIGEISEKLKRMEQRREEKRLRQIANSREAAGKRKSAEQGDPDEMGTTVARKRSRIEDEDKIKSSEGDQAPSVLYAESDLAPAKSEERQRTGSLALDPTEGQPPTKISVSKAFPEVRGHTSYLTFACLLPLPVDSCMPASTVDAPVAAHPPKDASSQVSLRFPVFSSILAD